MDLFHQEEYFGTSAQREEAYQLVRQQGNHVVLKEKAQYLNIHYPEKANRIISLADQYLDGMMVLCGTMGKPFFVGNPPAWHEKRVADNEYVWQLNRMEHWSVLLQSWLLTEDARYVEKVLFELLHWVETNPLPSLEGSPSRLKEVFAGVHPWRSLEAGIRAHTSWIDVITHLASTPFFTREVFSTLCHGFHLHGKLLSHVPPLIWPNADHNHYLTECLGLLEIACRFPFFPEAIVWKEQGIRELERCCRNQILDDGGQAEGCPTYHSVCVDHLMHSLRLAQDFSLLFSAEYMYRIRSTAQYSLYTTRPNGQSVPWGDSDCDDRGIACGLYHADLFDDPTLLLQITGLAGTHRAFEQWGDLFWKLRQAPKLQRILTEFTYNASLYPADTLHLACHKQVAFRTGWTPKDSSVFLACRLPVYNDHAHIDPAGFDFFAGGFPVLVDPGRYTYEEGAARYFFKSGAYHNTLQVNGKDAFEYLNTWGYGDQKEGRILSTFSSNSIRGAVCSHQSYHPSTHYRLIALLNSSTLLVVDYVTDLKANDIIYTWFHFYSSHLIQNGQLIQNHDFAYPLPLTASYSSNYTPVLIPSKGSTAIDHSYPTTRLQLIAIPVEQKHLGGFVLSVEGKPSSLTIVQEDQNIQLHLTLGEEYYQLQWSLETHHLTEIP